MTILRNLSLNRRRDAARQLVVADSPVVETSEAPDRRDNPEARLIHGVLAQDLQSALESLPESLRTTIWLRDVDELSYADIARQLGIPIGTVMSRLSRAREMLFRQLTVRAEALGDDRSGSAAVARRGPRGE
jgi:RNA polymerase sigma-70 factor (ECF subfamily)